VASRFPTARLARMDLDTTGERWAHERILGTVERGEVDLLIGTQMIAKGLDFPNVTLVGVVDADTGLHLPDFRAAERTFQLLAQVAGRAGRGPRGGRVIVQTRSPKHHALAAAARHDTDAFLAEERRQREHPAYPPFVALANVVISGPDEVAVSDAATRVAAWCAGLNAARALGLDGFDVRPLQGAAAIPEDAGLVVLAGATRDLRPPEVEALVAYVRRGGRLLVLADPGEPQSLRALLAAFGIEGGDDVVVDVQARLFGTDGLAARVAYLNQQIVPEVPEVQALLPVAQTLRLVEVPGVTADYLAVTSEGTWADVDRRALGGTVPEFRREVDRTGPLPVAVLARVPAGEGREGRVAVVGDADFATNLHVGVLGNRDLLLLVAELVARDRAIAAPHRRPAPQGRFSALFLTAREAQLVFWVAVAGPSTLFALAATAAARRRRHG
jgi:hypothetical protein